jgi:hypothetical protein
MTAGRVKCRHISGMAGRDNSSLYVQIIAYIFRTPHNLIHSDHDYLAMMHKSYLVRDSLSCPNLCSSITVMDIPFVFGVGGLHSGRTTESPHCHPHLQGKRRKPGVSCNLRPVRYMQSDPEGSST